MFRSLSGYNYRLWFIGALVSNVGTWMQSTTQSWVVLTDLTHNDAVAVGVTMSLQFGPQLLLVPVSGWIADRFDRRKILLCTQSALALLGLSLGLLLLLGTPQLWHIYLFALMLGLINAIDAPARQTFVSDLVSEHNMSNAVALNAASFNAARMIGPAVAGLLIVAVGSGWVFVINAFTFLAMIFVLSKLRLEEMRTRPKRAATGRGQLSGGFRYVAAHPDLVVIFAIVLLIGAFGLNFPIFSSTMAVEFGRGAGEYGILSSILAIGSLTGALLAARRARARLRVVILSAGGFGIAAAICAVMPTYASFAAATILLGFTSVSMLTTANGYVQTTTEPGMRGRVMALYMAILMGGTPIGAPVMGAIANTWGPRWALGIAGAISVVACLIGMAWMVIARDMRIRRHPDSAWRLRVTHLSSPDEPEPVEFSDELAATAPITLPKLPKPGPQPPKGTPPTP
ncbi:MFS transporter [Mycetocola tolaasinivorans]|uniref:MFS transporter n=1 Tax=Mycetocola tolaasinivorans TaxID=76635 RepID=A0A3L7A6K1_9MICO|nr:MFS transporter [Mycetocola tolaasinivorans]RLP75508.1 MFS transporter [Mycetocola tolaasinivorans]